MIHPSAIIDAKAQIDDGVSIGAYSIVGPEVSIAKGSKIGPHVVIEGPTRIGEDNKRYFQGLPSPAAAAGMVGFIWVCHDLQLSRADFAIPALIVTILLGASMVSNFSYYSFKDIGPSERVPFYAMLVIVLGFILASIDTPKMFFALFAVYALSGPVTYLIRLKRKRKLRGDITEETAEEKQSRS